LYLLGTSAATVELASAVEEEVAEVEVELVIPLELFELLPQPATTPTTTRSGTIVLKRVAGGSMGVTFLRWGRSACDSDVLSRKFRCGRSVPVEVHGCVNASAGPSLVEPRKNVTR
jgi:hypothetical protein